MKIKLPEAEAKKGMTGFSRKAMSPVDLMQNETKYSCRVAYRGKTCATDKFSFRPQPDAQRNGTARPRLLINNPVPEYSGSFPGRLVPSPCA
jgi:hypothetical protein